MSQENQPKNITQLAQEINALQKEISTLSAAELPAVLVRLQALLSQQAAMQAHIEGEGIVAQGEEIQIAQQDSIAVGGNAQIVIRGDNNSVRTIIRQTKLPQLDEEALRQRLSRYLAWVIDRSGTIELRSIKRDGLSGTGIDLAGNGRI
jgi:hypothetical protein